jgi:hypothetical protein
MWVVFPVEEQSFVGVHVVAGSRLFRESLAYLKEQFPNDVWVVPLRNKVVCKVAGDIDKIIATYVLFPESLQIAIDNTFQHAGGCADVGGMYRNKFIGF